MVRHTTTRQGAWMLAGAAAAAGAVGILLAIDSGRTEAGVDRSVESESRPEDPVEEAELVAPTEVESSARIAVTEEPCDELGHAATDEPAEPCIVEGVLLMPRGFPEAEMITLLAWSLADESNVAPVAGETQTGHTFRLDEVSAGSWTVAVRAQAPGRVAWGRSEPVTAVPGGHVRGVRVALQEYVVEGVVTDRDGRPLAGLPVAYGWQASDSFAGRSTEDFAAEFVGVEGSPVMSAGTAEVSLGDLSNAIEYTIPDESPQALRDTAREMEELARALDVVVRQTETTRSPILLGVSGDSGSPSQLQIFAPDGTSRGLVFNGTMSGLPVGEFGVSTISFSWPGDLSSFGGGHQETVVTDGAGVFRIALEGPGEVNLTAPGVPEEGEREWIPADRSVTLDEETPSERADFELQRAARIEGRIIRSDGEQPRISVFLRRFGGGGTQTENTDESGQFSFGELEPGKYLFYARSGGGQGQDFSLHVKVDVSEGGTAIIDDMLTPSSSVTGVVQDASGQPEAGVRVTAKGADNDNLTRTATTNELGTFEIVGMYACDYVLSVDGRKLAGEARVSVPPQGSRTDVGVLIAEKVAR